MGEVSKYTVPKLPDVVVRYVDELTIYRAVNATDSMQELALLVQKIGDENGEIMGRRQKWDAYEQAQYMMLFITGGCEANAVTRSFGLRQQMMYLRYYGKY